MTITTRTDRRIINFCKTFKSKRSVIAPKRKVDCTLISALNITLSFLPYTNILDVDFFSEFILDRNSGNIMKYCRSQNCKLELAVPSIELSRFAYIIISKEASKNNLNAMTQPFQENVWTLICLAMLIMPLALTLTTSKQFSMSLRNYWDLSFLTLASIVD